MKTHSAPFLLKELKLEVTHTCHLRCIHCSSLAVAECQRQMTWQDFQRILDEAAEMGVEEIAISGGEPLCWEHLPAAVEYAAKKRMSQCLYTTGIAPKAIDTLSKLRECGLSKVIFSIFGSTEGQHELVTNTKGSFLATVISLQNCIKLGLAVEIHFVPMSVNYMTLSSVVKLARELGVMRVSALRFVPQGRGAERNGLELDRTQNKTLRETIANLRSQGHDIRVGSPYNILNLNTTPKCCAGIDRLTISPELKISPCDAFKQITPNMLGVSDLFSNLSSNSLLECWEKSPYLHSIREYLTTPFAATCEGCSSLETCLSGCLAQKFLSYGELAKRVDPMCLAD